MRTSQRLLGAALLGLTSLIATNGNAVTTERIINADQEPGNWMSHGRDYEEQRFSPLQQISTENVDDLGLSWFFDSDSHREMEATPLIVDGVMYVTGAWSIVYALDARNGELLWKYDPQVPKSTLTRTCCGPVNRGVAIWQDTILLGTLDGRLQALDANNGKLLWSVLTVDPEWDYTITGAPRVINGKVFIGNGGGEFGVRGYISAYDIASGEMVWRFYTVPGNPAEGFENALMEKAAKSWKGEWWKYGGGGTVWDSMAYDPELDLLYFGVGNGSPWNRDIRSPGGGDNLFLSSIVAVRPDTGEYVWHYQETPAETWDYTATQSIILADINWQGQARKVILHAPKNGFFFVIDRVSGELLSAEPFVEVTWASHYDLQTGRPVVNSDAIWSNGSALVKPGTIGAHNWQPMAFHPGHKLAYIPANNLFQTYQDIRNQKPFTFNRGFWNTGNDFDEPMPIDDALLMQHALQETLSGELIAWSPEQQRIIWRVPQARPGNGGVLATAGNLVFQGDRLGTFSAYSADAGQLLWSFDSQIGILAAPVSYEIDGEQYVSVVTGRGGPASLVLGYEDENRVPARTRVLTFKLGANQALPALPAVRPDFPLPEMSIDKSRIDNGRFLFNNHCSFCHGLLAVGNHIVPDLRRLHPSWHGQFKEVVLGGMMKKAGMPAFEGVLTERQVMDIQHYVVFRAEELKTAQDPDWWYQVRDFVYSILAKIAAVVIY